MNKKTTFFLFGLITLGILSIYAYQKYAQYLPTTDTAQFSPNLTVNEIQKIRQNSPITHVKVYKAERKVQLLHHRQIIRSYVMRLGFDPLGHKIQEGDGKTPEGRYTLDWRNPKSTFYKSLHISYPNGKDKEKAAQLGVSAGGDVMIHGSATTSQVQKLSSLMQYLPKSDWTWGCIAVRNVDMDEIWKLVDDGTAIEIYP